MNTPIVLVACNARYSHSAFALKTLRANLPTDLRAQCATVEWTLQNDPVEAAYDILARSPRIVGLSVYLWSLPFMRTLAETLKSTHPEIVLFAGGPEIARPERRLGDPLFACADVLIVGEGERAVAALCRSVIDSQDAAKREFPELAPLLGQKVLVAPKPDMAALALPYDEYTDEDLAHRILYVETGRGCPYRCAFCLSSSDKPLRYFDLDRLFAAFQKLLDRGARSFKFLDRTLNASLQRALKILEFFAPYRDRVALHFEMVPHEIPDALLDAMAQFPPGAIQIEFGVQTLTPHVAQNIARQLDAERLLHNLHKLRTHTHVHIHADLIAGLPGESFDEFARGFERLRTSGVQEIQLGILKRLKGSPLDDQAERWGLVFASEPPYEILQTPTMSFVELTRFKRFARFYDTLVNNANFPLTIEALCHDDFFARFMHLTQWIYAHTLATQGISQTRWVALLFEYMTTEAPFSPQDAALLIIRDYLRSRKEDIPSCLKPHLPADFSISACKRASHANAGRLRQEKHLDVE